MLESLDNDERKRVCQTFMSCFGAFNCSKLNDESIFTFSIDRLIQSKLVYKVFPFNENVTFSSYDPISKMTIMCVDGSEGLEYLRSYIYNIDYVKRVNATIYINESIQERPKLEVVVTSAIDILDSFDKMLKDFEGVMTNFKDLSHLNLEEVSDSKLATVRSHSWHLHAIFQFFGINSLVFFKNGERIGNPFKERYTTLFRKMFEIFYTNLGEQLGNYVLENRDIQNSINEKFMEPVLSLIKDCRWLILLMQEYPEVFKFTQKHYDLAAKNEVARDNLYLIKRSLKQSIDSQDE
jgi:hypothetical protein